MPIEIEPIVTDQPTTVPLTADKLYQDQIAITANVVGGVRTPDASISVVNTPYAIGNAGAVFAATPIKLATASAYRLAAIVPEVGDAIVAQQVANVAWLRQHNANVRTLAAEQAAAAERLAVSTAAAATAEAAIGPATATRTAAHAARSAAAKLNADDPEKPAAVAAAQAGWESADAAWQQAVTAANDAAATAAAVQAANAVRLKIAEAAVADTANPPLTEAGE